MRFDGLCVCAWLVWRALAALLRTMASPVELFVCHQTARGWRAGFLNNDTLFLLAAASLRHARRCRWRLLRIALDVVMVTRPDASIRIEWRLATLHHEVTRELQAATATCKRLLKLLPSHFVSLEPPPCANIELFVAYRLSLVNESREARSRYNAVALLLQQVTKTKGRSMWRLLRGRTALAYFHVLRRLELRLTAWTAPPRSLEQVRNNAIMFASAAARLLGRAAEGAISLGEFQIDPCGLTPRFICRRRISRESLATVRKLQDEAESAFDCLMQGLRMLC